MPYYRKEDGSLVEVYDQPSVGQVMSDTSGYSPDDVAEIKTLSKKLKVSPEIVRMNKPLAQRIAAAPDLSILDNTAPVLAGMSRDHGFMSLASDDMYNLARIEQKNDEVRRARQADDNKKATEVINKMTFNWVPDFVKNTDAFREFASGQAVDRVGMIATLQKELKDKGQDLNPQQKQYLKDMQTAAKYDTQKTGFGSWVASASEIVGQMYEGATSPNKNPFALATASGLAAAGTAAMLSGPTAPITVPAAGAAGFASGMRAGMFMRAKAVEGGNAYLELQDLKDENGKPVPVDEKTARVASDMIGVINGSLELVGFEHAVKLVPGLNKVMKNGAMDLVKKNPTVRKAFLDYAQKVAGATAAETATESMQELTNIFTEGFMQDKGVMDVVKDPETAERVKGIMEKVAKGTVLLGGMGGSVDLYKNVRTAQKYQQSVQVHEALMDTFTATEQSLLSKRSKEDLADFMQRKADRDGNEFIYLQADRVIDEATKAGMSPDEITLWLDQYGVKKTDLDAAIERGGNITLEYGKTMAGIKEDEVLINLKNDLMVDPEISPVSTAVEDALAENNTMQRLTELYQSEQDRMITADDLDMWEKDILNQPGLKGKVTRDSLSLAIARSNALAKKKSGTKAIDHLNRMLMPDGLRAMKFADFAAEQQAMRDANGQPMMQMTHDFEQEGNYTFNEAEHRAPVMGWAKQQFGEAVAPNGKPAWQNFTNWFGDSKVVDADGKPLVVYHGTDRNFTKFSKKQRGLAYYFTANPDQAASYAGTKNANVMPVYIKSENLYRGGKESELLEAIKDGDDYYPYSISKIKEWMRDQNPAIFHIPSAIKALKRMGYDGFVEVENGVEQFGVFSPNQIKSATGNQGNFSPTDASILNQSAYSFSTNTRPYGFAGMSERAQKIADSLSDIIAVGDGTIAPDVLYSSRTWTVDEKSQIKELAKQMGIAEDKVDKWLYDIDNAMARVLADPSLDFIAEAADLYSALKPNSDPHYTVSLDFSTLCRKRYELVATIEAIQNRIGKAVTKELWVDIRQMLDDMGYNVSCGACYVDSKRMEAGKFINKFIDEHPEEDPRQFLSQAGIDQLKRDNPKLYAEFKKAIGSNNAKTPESRTDYHGEIRWYFLEGRDFDNKETKNTGLDAWTKNKNAARGKKRVEAMNKKSGLRWQSWSDFEVPHLMDAMQAILDMHMAGLMGHAYTKVPDFVLAMGKTGLMVNMSLIPKGTGLASDGTLIFDSKEGMPFDIALQLRDANEMTAGTIAIGVNNDHISAMLKDPRIDYVIPYHASGLSKDIAKRFNMDGWEDYTDTQTEDIKDYELFHKMIGKKDDKLVRMMLKVTDPAAWVKAETKYAKAEIVKTKEPKLTKSGSPSKKQLTEAEIKKKVTALNNYLAELEAYGESVSNMSNEELAAERVKSIAAYRKAAKASGLVNIDTTEYWDDTKSGDDNAKAYLALAESRGVLPKFRGKVYSNGKVLRDFTQEPGYWKLLIDRKMYDHSGNNIVQEAVKPEYDEAAIKDIFDRASGNPTPDAAAADVVNHFSQQEGYTGPLMQSAGIVDITDTPEFKQWFGDSKVVDAEGKPLVVYHGTTSSFDSFDPKMNGSVTRATSSKSGFFFTSSPRTAQSYADHGAIVTPVERLIAEAEKAGDSGKWDLYDKKINEAEQLEAELADPANRGRGQNLIPAYLTLKNPLVFDANGENPSGIGGIDRLIQKAKKDGHDGVIIKNFDDAAGISNDNSDHYIAFSPTQIKSVFNRGTFDPNNPNILMQSAWHGSPHTFDKFSTSAIGTGEGAQAYGYGLYFAGSKEVAEYYRSKLSGLVYTFNGEKIGNIKDVSHPLAEIAKQTIGDSMRLVELSNGAVTLAALNDVSDLKEMVDNPSSDYSQKEAMIALAFKDAGVKQERQGRLYKVELAPAEDEYLLWDKPLSKQTPKVKQALKDAGLTPKIIKETLGDYDTGAEIYKLLAAEGGFGSGFESDKFVQGSDKAASEYLHSLGIRGIKYEDGNTRNKDGEKNYNYVIFSDDDVAIQEMYQKMNGRKRGGYDPSRLTTILTQDTDYSTFLHETGHFFLDTYSKIASDPNAPAAIKEDMQTILNWFGIESLEAWNAMDLEQQRQYHEQFAYNFEIWVAEGKSPSIKMESVFRTFGRFLKQVYENIRDELNDVYRQEHGKDLPILTGEVRQVMERMLASEKQIKEGEQVRAMAPIFEVQPESMSDEEWAAYREMQQQAHDNALDEHTRASLRSLKWLEGAKSRVFKALQNQAKEARDGIKSEVTEYIKKMPVYRAIRFIKRGEYDVQEDANQKAKRAGTEMGMGSTKLSIASLKEMYGEEANAIWRHLPTGPNGLIATDGVHPDVIAEMFGFKSGDEMVREILASKPMKDAINEETDRRMLEEHDELTDPDAIQEAVDRAIHNDLRAKFIGVELRHLAKTQRPVRVMQEAARRAAVQMLDTMRLKDLRPSDYAAAEAKASKAADAALKKGDIAAATTAKEQQLLQNQLASEALKLKEQMKKDMQYLEKIQKDSARKKMGPEAADQIDMLLEKFDLKPPSMKQADEIAKFKTWVKSQLNQGQIPDMAVNLLSPEERRAFSAEMEMRDEEGELIYKDEEDAALMLAEAIDKSAKRPYYDLTFDEWQGLVDTVRNIHHLGKTKTMMLAMADGLSYEQTRDEIANSIVINAKKGGKNTRTAADWLGKKFEALKQFGASHIKVATWARIMDGGKDDGPMWRFFIQTANERANRETTQRAAATEKLAAILAPILKKVPVSDKVGKGRYFELIGESLNWEARMAIAMNYGNDSNLQRLLDGMGWTIEQIMPVLNSLTMEEWKAAEAIGAHFESYRPQIAEKEKRVTGKEPKWIEPREFAVMTADGQRFTSKGWYYPVVFDPRLSLAASQHAAAEESKNQMKAAYNAATTRRSFVKERVEKVVGRPVLLTLQGLYSGVNDVIHDLAWHEWVIDANKLLRSKSIDGAIREHYGPEIKKEFEKWRDDIVAGTRRLDHSIEKAAGFFRQSVSMAGLGFNIVSALMQPFGLINSGVRIGHRWMGHGIAQYISNGPAALTREVKSMSSFMDNRARTRFRELNELRNQIQGQTAVKEVMGRYAYWMMMQTQMIVDVITWKAAYDKAMSEGHFKADEDGDINDRTAINLADQAVKDAQGGGEEIDQAGVERGGPLIKLFTTFYSFMATTANVAFLEGMTEKSRAKAAVNIILVLSVQPMLGALLKDAVVPGGDDDDEKIAKKLAAEQISFLLGLVAFGREFSQAGRILAGDGKGMGYSGPPGLRMISDVYKLAAQARQGEFDVAFAKAFVNVLGDATGIPSVQVNRLITGAKALSKGKTKNPAALIMGYQNQ